MMNKIIGLLTAWGAKGWIRPAIKQALEYCDEVIIVIAAYNSQLKKFEDNTYDICKEYPDARLLGYETLRETVSKGRCEVLNYMLGNSNLHSPGNWIWLLDVDEFYTEASYEKIKSIIESNKYDKIEVEAKIFFINMQHYLKGSYSRLIKIENIQDKFKPTNNWSREAKNKYILSGRNEMFHYCMLTDIRMHHTQWKTEYPGRTQPHKVRWASELYPKYNLKNEGYWVKKNLKMFGVKSPWCNNGFVPNKNGGLFKYRGEHPRFIEEVKLPEVKDFRKWYNK